MPAPNLKDRFPAAALKALAVAAKLAPTGPEKELGYESAVDCILGVHDAGEDWSVMDIRTNVALVPKSVAALPEADAPAKRPGSKKAGEKGAAPNKDGTSDG